MVVITNVLKYCKTLTKKRIKGIRDGKRGKKWSIRGRGRCRCKLLEAREGRFVKNFKMISVEGSGT